MVLRRGQLFDVRSGILMTLWMGPTRDLGDGRGTAASVLATVRGDMTESGVEESGADPRSVNEHQGNPYHSTARLWDDGVIDPPTPELFWTCSFGCGGQAPPSRSPMAYSGCDDDRLIVRQETRCQPRGEIAVRVIRTLRVKDPKLRSQPQPEGPMPGPGT